MKNIVREKNPLCFRNNISRVQVPQYSSICMYFLPHKLVAASIHYVTCGLPILQAEHNLQNVLSKCQHWIQYLAKLNRSDVLVTADVLE